VGSIAEGRSQIAKVKRTVPSLVQGSPPRAPGRTRRGIICDMRTLSFIVLMAGAHFTFSQTVGSTEAVTGCYELRLLNTLGEAGAERLPRRFVLTTRAYSTSTKKSFVVRNLDPKVRWDLPLSSWNAKEDGTLQIVWSTGFVGWNIHLSKSGSELRGRAHYFTDTDSNFPEVLTPANSLPVVVHKTECKEKVE